MSIQELFEEGDTGEAILPVPVSAIAARLNASRIEAEKVNGAGAQHADHVAKIRELVEYGEKRFAQWQEAEARAEKAEALLGGLPRRIRLDSATRGDLDWHTVRAIVAHVRNLVIDYKIERDGGYDFLSDGEDDGEPPTPEGFKRVRHEVAAARARLSDLCPYCYEPAGNGGGGHYVEGPSCYFTCEEGRS